MANTHEEPGILNSAVVHSLPEHTAIEDAANEQTEQEGVHEEVLQHLRQALADANTFDSTSITYTVVNGEPQVCDTDNRDASVTEVHSEESDLVANSASILHHPTEAIFPNGGQDTLLTNDSSEVLGMDTNNCYSVDAVPEGHVISIPSDIISDAAIITENGDHLQNSVEISEDSDVQLLQEASDQQLNLVGHVESNEYAQQTTDTSILQQDSNTRQEVLQAGSFPQAHHAITLSAPSGMSMTPEVLQTVLQQVQAQHLAQQQGPAVEAHEVHVKEEPTAISTCVSTSAPVSFTVVSPSQSTGTSATGTIAGSTPAPPLGSSQNPIRIIQQGNRYTPMQQLSPEQLQQIMQVVQQQHVNKTSQDGNGGAIIFNPQTNTRIMYRVIYPSELHKTQSPGGHTTYQVVRPSTATQEQQTGLSHQKRPYRRRKDMAAAPAATTGSAAGVQEDRPDKSAGEGPELSKEEKEERKKHRPRTRCGRVSKPPKHMVQDYKHIHVLDWDEDYDDSDGGYSDFKHSDEEGTIKNEAGEDEQQPKSPDLFSGLGAVRPKNHKCQSCDKSYIGQAGLARHYRLNPDHCVNPSEDGSISSLHNGSIDGDDSKDTPLAQESNLSRLSDSALDITTTPGGPNSGSTNLETFSEDSNTQDSLNSTGAPSPHTVLGHSSHRGRGRGRFRGRWAHLKYNAHMRRKNKLKEFIKQCSDEELMEVVLPRLVTSISLWEFLMMKSEKGGARPQVDVMYREFESLTQHVRQACSTYLQPLSQEELEDDSLQCKMIKVSDKRLGICLDLEPVTYRVREMPAGDCNTFSSLHNKLSAAAIARPQEDSELVSLSYLESVGKEELRVNGGLKRPLDSSNTIDDELHNVPKRPRISTLPIPISATSPGLFTIKAHLPMQVVSAEEDSTQEVLLPSDSLGLSLCGPANSAVIDPAIQVVAPSMASISPPSSLPNSVSLVSSATSSSPSTFSSSVAVTAKPITTSGSSARSPFVHISCPSTKQQIGSSPHVQPSISSVASSKVPTTGQSLLVSTVNSNSRVKPQVVAVGAAGFHTAQTISSSTTSTTTSILPPLIAGSGVSVGTQRFVLATPGTHTLLAHQGAGPGTALLLAAGAAAGNHRILVRHPPPVTATHKQLRQNKVNHQTAIPTTFRSLLAPSNAANATAMVTKPTEVKVSRQLFHDATLSSSASLLGSSKTVSLLMNGKATAAPSTIKPATSSSSQGNQLLATTDQVVSKEDLPSPKSRANLSDGTNIITSNKTLETPPSGQQFVTSPNKRGNTNSHGALSVTVEAAPMSEMDVMGLEFPSVDDLGSTLVQTPTDSFNGSFASTSSSVVTTMVAGSHFLNHSHSGSVSDSLFTSCKPNGDAFVASDIKTEALSSAGEQPHKSLLLSSPLSNNNESSSLLTSNRLKSKTTLNHIAASHAGATNGSLLSQPVKSENNTLVTSLSDLQFSNQAEELPPEATSAQLSNGDMPSVAQPTGISSQLEIVDTVLTEELPGNGHPTQSVIGEVMEQEGISGSTESFATGENGQQQQHLLLSEGTNIYQAEDGTLFIQSSNGNTYQLQGAQGLPLETVQALLSGTLDQLAS